MVSGKLIFQRKVENLSMGHSWLLSNFFPQKTNYPSFWNATLHKKRRKKYRYYRYFVAKVSIVSISNFFDTCHHTAHKISHHTHTICKRAELMSKTYKNGLFKKKSVQKSKNPYFWKNLYKNPCLYGQIRTSGKTAHSSVGLP